VYHSSRDQTVRSQSNVLKAELCEKNDIRLFEIPNDYVRRYKINKENLTNRIIDSKEKMAFRIEILEKSCKILVDRLENSPIDRKVIRELKKVKKMQWSILQHYEVCKTPFLDVTQSLNVACSFALNDNLGNGFIYVLALPYVTGRISVDSEDDITNIRLLSICPHQAKRPFFQEGYLIGTEFILGDYDNKSELDFNNRIVAIYELENNDEFWGTSKTASSYNRIDNMLLFPDVDVFKDICNEIIEQDAIKAILKNDDLSKFLLNYIKINELLNDNSSKNDEQKANLPRIISENMNRIKNMSSISNQIIDVSRRGYLKSEVIKDEIKIQDEIIDSID
jgi:hypothetical protein